jgi:hypothetical protein
MSQGFKPASYRLTPMHPELGLRLRHVKMKPLWFWL